jgi:uncharacterized protein
MQHLGHYVFRVELEDQGRCLLVNGLNGATVEMNALTADRLQDEPYVFGVTDSGQSSRFIDGDIIAKLQEKGFLTDLAVEQEREGLRERVNTIAKSRAPYNHTAFWITPTYDCQLRCSYCFMFHPSSGIKRELETKRVMDPSMVDAAFDAMSQIQPNPARRLLRLFGGDPLQLQHAEIGRYLLRKARQEQYPTQILSNCVDLDAFLDDLSPDFISFIQVALDGPRHVHDQLRVLTKSQPTFENIATNVGLALARGLTIKVRIQVSRSSLNDLPELAEEMASRGWFDYPNFSACVSLILPSDLSPDELGRFFYQQESNKWMRRIAAWQPVRRDTVIPLLVGNKVRPQITACAKQTGLYIFDAMGRIYDCPEMLGYVDHAIGEYARGHLQLFDRKIEVARNRLVSEIPECMDCPFVLMCGGGCEFEGRDRNVSEPSFPYRPACQGFQTEIKGEIGRAYRKLTALQVSLRANSGQKSVESTPDLDG